VDCKPASGDGYEADARSEQAGLAPLPPRRNADGDLALRLAATPHQVRFSQACLVVPDLPPLRLDLDAHWDFFRLGGAVGEANHFSRIGNPGQFISTLLVGFDRFTCSR